MLRGGMVVKVELDPEPNAYATGRKVLADSGFESWVAMAGRTRLLIEMSERTQTNTNV
jgi:hypothetical protein